jgi:hypothetical protein
MKLKLNRWLANRLAHIYHYFFRPKMNFNKIWVPVLDLVSQVPDVVLVRSIFSSGKPQGVGIWEWGVYGEGDGNGEISLRATWDRGGQDPITARRVPSK